MNKNWEVKKLGEVCEIKPPKKQARDRLGDDDFVSFVPMEDLGILTKDFIATRERPLKEVSGSYTYFSDNDVLLAKITPCFENGKIGIARNLKNGIGFGSSEYIVFRSRGELIPDYLYYFLARDQFRQEGKKVMTGAVGHKRVPKDFIENQEIPYPKSLPEQQRIVSILDETFAAITKAKENAEKNLQNSRELFESYLQSVFANHGDGWEEKKLGEVCSLITDGKHGDCNNEENSGYYFLSAKDVKNNTLNYENTRQITKVDFEETHRRTNLKPGDVLVTNSGTIGRMAIAPFDDKTYRTTFQKSVAVIKPIPEFINNVYCCYHLKADLSKLVNVSSGTAQKNLLLGDLRKHAVFLPSISEQCSIVSKIDAFSSETKRLEAIYQQKLAALDELKKSVLQKAFNGELAGA